MKISRFLLPAVTLAGALALAGCGGDGDPMEDDMGGMGSGESTSNGDGDGGGESTGGTGADTGGTGTATSQFSDAALPSAASGIVYNADNRQHIQVGTGKSSPVGSSNVSVTCPPASVGGCLYRVTPAGGIETTNGGIVGLTNPVPAAPGAPASDSWLSGPNLVGSVPAGGTPGLSVTINGVKRTVTSLAASATTPIPGAQLTGTGIAHLWLRHNKGNNDPDFMVWGSWVDAPTASVSSPTPEHTFGGSVPHGKPTKTAGSAAYDGDAQGFYKAGSGSWKPWKGDARLTANFSTQKVTGVIANTIDDVTGTESGDLIEDHVNSIRLGSADMGASLSGKATIRGVGGHELANSERNAPSSGTWNGAFFGPTSADPTGVAGSFSAKRPEAPATIAGRSSHVPGKWHGAVGNLEVSGAFGTE